MQLDLAFFAMAIPATLFAGISKGGFGSGAAFASALMLAVVIPPREAIGVMLPLLMLIDLSNLRPYWRKWAWRDGRGMMIGMVPGVIIAALLFGIVNDDAVRIMIGTIALGFVAFQFARRRDWITVAPRPFSAISAAVWGAVAAFTSFISHAGGPPAAMYLLGRRLTKLEYQATTVLIFWWVNLLKFGPYALLGMFSTTGFLAALLLSPVALLGAALGVRAHHWISERTFFAVTYVALTVTGAKLIWDAIS